MVIHLSTNYTTIIQSIESSKPQFNKKHTQDCFLNIVIAHN
jgi:hypothetical protein